MATEIVEDDLVKVVRKKAGKFELLTMLAWGDKVQVIGKSATKGYKDVKVEHYELQPDNSYKKELVTGMIKSTAKFRDQLLPGILQASYVDVQQGDGMVIETPKGKIILIDGGDNKLFARYLAERFSRCRKDDALSVEAIVVTHGDADHFAGLTEIYGSQDNPNDKKRLFLRPKRIFHNGIVSATTKIGMLRTTTVNDIWDNKIYAASMDSSKSGDVVNTKHHCATGIYPFCGYDKHLIKSEITLNSNTNAKPYAATESCGANQVANTYDIEKVLSHEMYHIMGFAHDGNSASPIYYTYMCGSSYGYSLTTHDDAAITAKYP